MFWSEGRQFVVTCWFLVFYSDYTIFTALNPAWPLPGVISPTKFKGSLCICVGSIQTAWDRGPAYHHGPAKEQPGSRRPTRLPLSSRRWSLHPHTPSGTHSSWEGQKVWRVKKRNCKSTSDICLWQRVKNIKFLMLSSCKSKLHIHISSEM